MAPHKQTARSAPRRSHRSSSVARDIDTEQELPPFFNTTFSTHRVSPLYVGPEGLTTARLDLLARRLRDTLVGDVVRGIQISVEATETPGGQVGTLRTVAIRRFKPRSILGEPDSQDGAVQEDNAADSGIWIQVRHENAAYVALLLPGNGNPTSSQTPSWTTSLAETRVDAQLDESQFVHLPLLLLRMPQALKAVIGQWLSTTFDCRVSKLNLGTKTLTSIWEGWISSAGLPTKGSDFVMTLAFNAPLNPTREDSSGQNAEGSDGDGSLEPGLRGLEITISPSDLARFLRIGQAEGPFNTDSADSWDTDKRERRRLAGSNADDGWAWRNDKSAPTQPFTEALARYLHHHTALNLFHPSVRVVQISCGAFVLSQSKLKLVKVGDITEDLARAAWMFVKHLGARVAENR
ncbi:hypothetical protein HIM_00965 [Hirsutella minnesotensis 3608]|nr:hypothetical protein HIM_00965 [Hirsutella minnesotensis 3608]